MEQPPNDAGPWWVAAAAAAGLGLAGVVAMLFTKLKTVVEVVCDRAIAFVAGRGKIDWTTALSFLSEFSAILAETRRVECVTRVLVFVGHNGGGLPTPGSPYTVRTQTGWVVRDGVPQEHGGFAFDLEVDAHYCEMLTEVHRKGRVLLTVSEMPACLLRGIYESEGVVQSIIYALRVDSKSNRFGYVSVASNNRPFTTGELSKLDIIAARLKATLDDISPR